MFCEGQTMDIRPKFHSNQNSTVLRKEIPVIRVFDVCDGTAV